MSSYTKATKIMLMIFALIGFSSFIATNYGVIEKAENVKIKTITKEVEKIDVFSLEETLPPTSKSSIPFVGMQLSEKDLETLRILVYTESGNSGKFEWDLILESILFNFYESGEPTLSQYIQKNKWVFQGWINRKDYYKAQKGSWVENGKKISCPGCKKKVVDIDERITKRILEGAPRPIKFYHRELGVDSVKIGGKMRSIDKSQYNYVKRLVKKKKIHKVANDTLLHDFFELPKDSVPKKYLNWRKSLRI